MDKGDEGPVYQPDTVGNPGGTPVNREEWRVETGVVQGPTVPSYLTEGPGQHTVLDVEPRGTFFRPCRVEGVGPGTSRVSFLRRREGWTAV